MLVTLVAYIEGVSVSPGFTTITSVGARGARTF